MEIVTLILLFCVAPVMIASVPIIAAAQKAWLVGKEKQRRIELHETRIREAAERRAHTLAVRDAKISEAHNRNQLLELKIEQEALKLEMMKKEAGLNNPDFTPADYDSDRPSQ